MSRHLALAVMLAVAVCACGKYGPPERTVTLESKETLGVTSPEPVFPEETLTPEPALPEETMVPEPDFEKAEPDEENDQ
jgi:hypothetical protein